MPVQRKKSGTRGGRKRQEPTRDQPKPEPEKTPESIAAKALELELQQHADLMDAARRGSVGKMQELVDAGANLEAQDKRGETAFHVCCYKGHLACVKVLLNGGCSMDVLDATGCTGLMSAANSGRLEILAHLLDEGSDMEKASLHGHTAFMLAYLNGHASCVRLLVERGCTTTSRTKGLTGLMEAAMGGRTAVVCAMLDGGVEKNAVDEDGRTAFHWACAKNHVECAEALFHAGCDTTIESKQGHTGVHIAQRLGHVEIVNRMRELVAHKLANATEYAGNTLTGDGISRSQRGYTAFHLACAGGQVQHVEAMFRAGVDTACVTKTNDKFAGETGYDVAKRLGHTAVLCRLDELQAEAAKKAKKERDNRRKKEQKRRKREQQRKLVESRATNALHISAESALGEATPTVNALLDFAEPVAEAKSLSQSQPWTRLELQPEPETQVKADKHREQEHDRRRVPDDEGSSTSASLDVEEAPEPHGSLAGRARRQELIGGLSPEQVESIVAPLLGSGARFLDSDRGEEDGTTSAAGFIKLILEKELGNPSAASAALADAPSTAVQASLAGSDRDRSHGIRT